MPSIVLIDYGVGNLLSVGRALEYVGANVSITNDVNTVKHADYLVLPGVGAFSNAINKLNKLGLAESILEYCAKERPFLGICLGMQLLFDTSMEFGEHKGLGIFPGKVEAIPRENSEGIANRIPHIGWSSLTPSIKWSGSILADIIPGNSFYFVHSYMCVPECEEHRLATTSYNNSDIVAVVKRGNIYGCQFHPEKSGVLGLDILRKYSCL